jgi:hypothetical protein
MSSVIHGQNSIDQSVKPAHVSDNAIHVAQYVWDTNTLSWIKQTGGTGAGTDVTVTNFPAVQTTDSAARKLEVDANNPAIIYIGEAAIGAGTSSAAWRIQKIMISGSNVEILYSGNNFTAIWDNRASLSYT